MNIRIATPDDAQAIVQIYAPYVTETAITFDYDVPTVSEYAEKISHILASYPFIVAEEEGRIIGYAYASIFRVRVAYIHTVEVSIYVDRDYHGRGTGRALYLELERLLALQNVYILYACITTTERADDAHLDDGSVHFHEKMGYRHIGGHPLSGYKFGKWYSVVWMEKVIASRPDVPDDFIPFPRV